jgi:hypothetical protein
MNALAQEDARRIEIAEQRALLCANRVRRAATTLDRVLMECGDEEARRRLAEGALGSRRT